MKFLVNDIISLITPRNMTYTCLSYYSYTLCTVDYYIPSISMASMAMLQLLTSLLLLSIFCPALCSPITDYEGENNITTGIQGIVGDKAV